ncbi:phage tail protein [Lacticaseibacillus yichunensis]|uniref:Phage tail protein n=1 Tax=Lacticaseibacillus yichunensis TaxID=2486015 RepID=A0ABW4CLY9_9LACO|nr:phage tail protein [Lacticaseibacillus yichunensis]
MNEFTVKSILGALKETLDEMRGQPLGNSLSGIFTTTPPYDELQTTPDEMAPFMRVTMLPGDAADYADDARVAEYPRVQVDAWLPVTTDYADLQSQIYAVMHAAGWERDYKDAYVDVDTPSLRMIIGYYEYQGLPLG